jgi:arylsulfatase A-like enzyme
LGKKMESISNNSKKSIIWIAIVGLLLASLSALKLNSIFSDKLSKRPNLLLITLDTLRPDHLGVYGYKRPTSPSIFELAKDSFVFEKAFTVATNSGPSHATLLTGLYPAQHGLVDNGQKILNGVPTLAETLHHEGFDTAGFVGYHALNRESGLNRGFQHFEFNPIANHEHDEKKLEDDQKGFVAVADWLEFWAETPDKSQFFVWMHVQNIHESFDPPAPYRTMFGQISGLQLFDGFEEVFDIRCSIDLEKAWRAGVLPSHFKDEATALYDGEIHLVDDQLGLIFKKLKSFDVYDDTVIVVVADHGEVLFELYKNEFYKRGPGHTARYTDTSIQIPLIIKPAKLNNIEKEQRIKQMVSSIDLFPTFLELLGFPVPSELSGVSLVPVMRQPTSAPIPGKIFFHEKPDGVEYAGIRTDQWKFVTQVKNGSKRSLLIDLENDPNEDYFANLKSKAKARELEAALRRWKQNMQTIKKENEISKEMIQALKDGGYLLE